MEIDFKQTIPAIASRISELKTKSGHHVNCIRLTVSDKKEKLCFLPPDVNFQESGFEELDVFLKKSLNDLKTEQKEKQALEQIQTFIFHLFEKLKADALRQIDNAYRQFLQKNIQHLFSATPILSFFDGFINGELNDDDVLRAKVEELAVHCANPPLHAAHYFDQNCIEEALRKCTENLMKDIAKIGEEKIRYKDVSSLDGAIRERRVKQIDFYKKVTNVIPNIFKMESKVSLKEGVSTSSLAFGKFWIIDKMGHVAMIKTDKGKCELIIHEKLETVSSLARYSGTLALSNTLDYLSLDRKSFFCYNCIVPSPSATKFAASSADCAHIFVRSSLTGKEIWDFSYAKFQNFLRVICWMDEDNILSGSEDGSLQIFNLRSKNREVQCVLVKSPVYSLAAGDGDIYFIGYKNGALLSVVFNKTFSILWQQIYYSGQSINSIGQGGAYLAIGGSIPPASMILIVRKSDGQIVKKISDAGVFRGEVLTIDWSPRLENLVVITSKEMILLVFSKTEDGKLEGSEEFLTKIAASECSKSNFVSGRTNWLGGYVMIADSNGFIHQVELQQ